MVAGWHVQKITLSCGRFLVTDKGLIEEEDLMNENAQTQPVSTNIHPAPNAFVAAIQNAQRKSAEADQSFFIVLLQLENFKEFRNKRAPHVANALLRELNHAFRQAVHPSQFVGIYEDGLGLIFSGVDGGKVDSISQRLTNLAQNIIRKGHYNDLSSRWTDVLTQFLFPANPLLLMARAGWAVYPRDGATPTSLITRARNHIAELLAR
jgi:GGDEF domain-containing protein